ncbi:MAG: gliding motility-associated C-terminal domain-containing protein [Saprospiraceae bacterium]|nr:gliding motility-associated C-terminal domain-containing protein [Candidatus Defluviibacterium haderslevense]
MCYIKEKYSGSELVIEKKIESDELIYSTYTPLLADVDGDCVPELITPDINNQNILIINTKSGNTKYRIATFELYPFSNNFCIGDIDGDGTPEIFVVASPYSQNPVNIQGKLICYNLKGDVIWISDQRVDLNYIGNLIRIFGVPGLADFNQDGIPEIYISNKIFNSQTGVKLADGGPNGIGSEINPSYFSPLSIAAQLDEDFSDLELAAGYSVYKVIISNISGMAGNNMIAMNIKINNELRDGTTTISDINLDGRLDVVVTSPGVSNEGLVYVYTLSNSIPKLIAKAYPPGGSETVIGSPLLGDIKGFGKPSIVFSRVSKIYSYSYNGSGFLQQDWSQTTTDTSGVMGITMFDLNNDGVQELIYRDMNSLNIVDGSSNPVIIASINCFSPTWYESPIVGDLDNTGHAKICVPCSFDIYNTDGKLTIFGPPDSIRRWAPSRGIWNQYNYHVLNINDDLTVPRVQKNNATYKNGKYNNFYVQESLLDSNGMSKKPAASLTGNIKCINYDPLTNEYIVVFDLYNRKDASNEADSNLAVSFYNGDPTSSGTLIGIYYTLKTILAGDSLLNLEYRFTASNLKDLFMVVNTIKNGSGVFDDKDFNQAECDYTDNISRTLELPKLDIIQATICKGATYQFLDTSIQDPGKYYRKLSNIKGCDSLIHILNLNTVDTIYTKQSIQACDDYQWNNKLLTHSGIYVFDTLNQFGCDSIISLDLVINTSNSLKIKDTACYSYYWNGQTYYNSGSYSFQTKNNSGCDSTTTLDLFIYKTDTTDLIVESCNDYYWGRYYYNMSGYWKFDTVNRFGCDSMINLWLTIIKEIKITQLQTACDSLIWNGVTYTQSGIYNDTTQSFKGCDSITTLQLTISKSNQAATKQTSCDSYHWNGTTYTQSGTYTFTNRNVNGCDSIETLQLIINKSTNSTTNMTTCDSLMWNNIVYKKSGTYQYTTLNASGCDSIATLNLIVNPTNQIHIQQTACNSYTWNGKTYTQSGLYNYQTKNITGCDSIITLDLNIIPSSLKDTSITICDSIIFLNKTLNTKGNYTFTLKNTQGCDSVIHLNLNINSQNFKANVSICGSYQWNVNGITYDSSGIYIAKYTNQSACDSTYQLDLTIHKNYEIKEKAEVCNEYLWPVNKELYTQSGDYIYPLKTNQGCDSIIKLNLFVNPEFQHTDTVSTTDVYTWPVNQKTYPSSGTYQEVYQTQNGCDSIHLLLLSINKDVSIYYPNIIHPGGLNSYFTIYVYGASATIKTLSIYDRWGERIWQKHNFPPNELQQGWGGKFKDQDVMPGVYVWHAELLLRDGSVIVEKGDVTVMR